MKPINSLYVGFCFGAILSSSLLHGIVKTSYITREDFGTLAENMAHGCEPEQQRIEETIRDYCSHPLTKGTKNVRH